MMKVLLITIISCIAICTTVQGQSNYDAQHIPKSLTDNASAVIRMEEQAFDIESPSKAQLTYKVAITILNKAGDRFANMTEIYDQFSTISDINATLYDATGNKIRSYKKADFKDRSLMSDFSIYEDNRIKYLPVAYASYPFTIEYSYTKTFKGFLTIPPWHPASSFGVAVEKSTYTIQSPSTYRFKRKTSSELPLDSATTDGKTYYKWTCSNLPAIIAEPYSVGLGDLVPWVSAAPTVFEYDGSQGNIQDWNTLGKWLYTLNEHNTALSEATKSEINMLVKGVETDEEKIRLLYSYLQQNTRYVSVQLGIGGFKAIDADKVAQVHYGDCKALSNFMRAMLQEVGIASNLLVIGNDLPSLDETYASFGQANHMILYVPLAGDTVFLECTSQYYPMGFIGYGNADRRALMVGAEGGKLITTPPYVAHDNYQNRDVEVTFADDLAAEINMTTIFGHEQFAANLGVLLAEPSEQRKHILRNMSVAGVELVDYTYTQTDKNKPELTEKISFKSQQLLSKGGDRLFLTANLFNRRENVPPTVVDRKTHFTISFDYTDLDEIVYRLPEGYMVEYLPENIELTSEFGTYSAEYKQVDQSIIYRRRQLMDSEKYPPAKYAEFVAFCKKVYQADKQKIVLVKI